MDNLPVPVHYLSTLSFDILNRSSQESQAESFVAILFFDKETYDRPHRPFIDHLQYARPIKNRKVITRCYCNLKSKIHY